MKELNANMGKLATTKSIELAMKDITRWLSMVGVNGLDIDLRHDAATNVALLRFRLKGKDYEFKSTKQSNCRLNMWGIARVMEWKVRSHIMKIEEFSDSMYKYTPQIEGQVNIPQSKHTDELNYAVMGISPLASNEELQKRYKTLLKTFHPDMALSPEAKAEFERRAQEINKAWEAIKKERGL